MIKLKQVQAITGIMDKYNKRQATVDEAVRLLIEELSFGDRTIIANMKEEDLGILDFAIGKRLKREFGLGNGNEELLQSCCSKSKQLFLKPDSA